MNVRELVSKVSDFHADEPVLAHVAIYGGVIQAIFPVLEAFGLWKFSTEQQAAISALVIALLALKARAKVTPAS